MRAIFAALLLLWECGAGLGQEQLCDPGILTLRLKGAEERYYAARYYDKQEPTKAEIADLGFKFAVAFAELNNCRKARSAASWPVNTNAASK